MDYHAAHLKRRSGGHKATDDYRDLAMADEGGCSDCSGFRRKELRVPARALRCSLSARQRLVMDLCRLE